MRQSKPSAVFLDRDGVIIKDVGYLRAPEQLRLLPGAAAAIARLNRAGIPVIAVTNQSAVARGWLSLDRLEQIHDELKRRLAAAGAHLDAIYSCPHHPAAGVGAYRRECDCRKPAPGMLLRAAREWDLELPRAVMIGDKLSDLEAGRRAGCATALVLSGEGRRTQWQLRARGLQALADAVFTTFPRAVDWCLRGAPRP